MSAGNRAYSLFLGVSGDETIPSNLGESFSIHVYKYFHVFIKCDGMSMINVHQDNILPATVRLTTALSDPYVFPEN